MKQLAFMVCLFIGICESLYGGTIQKVSDTNRLDYQPLLEVGKEWRYTEYHIPVYEPKQDDGESVIRIDGVKELDGVRYYSVEQFQNGELIYDGIEYGGKWHLWEDCDEKKVYSSFVSDDDTVTETVLLYDFADPANRRAETYRRTYNLPYELTRYEGPIGEYNAFYLGDRRNNFSKYLLVEGLGFVTAPEREDIPGQHCFGTLLDGPMAPAAGGCVLPKIYEIVNGDGEVIYYLKSAEPITTSVRIVERPDVRIYISGTSIVVDAEERIGHIGIYSTVGSCVSAYDVADTHCEIPLSGLSAGCYILKTDTSYRKFIVR